MVEHNIYLGKENSSHGMSFLQKNRLVWGIEWLHEKATVTIVVGMI
jgi:hypothetical protein